MDALEEFKCLWVSSLFISTESLLHSCQILPKIFAISCNWKLLALILDFPPPGREDATTPPPPSITVGICFRKSKPYQLEECKFAKVHFMLDTEAEFFVSSQGG